MILGLKPHHLWLSINYNVLCYSLKGLGGADLNVVWDKYFNFLHACWKGTRTSHTSSLIPLLAGKGITWLRWHKNATIRNLSINSQKKSVKEECDIEEGLLGLPC